MGQNIGLVILKLIGDGFNLKLTPGEQWDNKKSSMQ